MVQKSFAPLIGPSYFDDAWSDFVSGTPRVLIFVVCGVVVIVFSTAIKLFTTPAVTVLSGSLQQPPVAPSPIPSPPGQPIQNSKYGSIKPSPPGVILPKDIPPNPFPIPPRPTPNPDPGASISGVLSVEPMLVFEQVEIVSATQAPRENISIPEIPLGDGPWAMSLPYEVAVKGEYTFYAVITLPGYQWRKGPAGQSSVQNSAIKNASTSCTLSLRLDGRPTGIEKTIKHPTEIDYENPPMQFLVSYPVTLAPGQYTLMFNGGCAKSLPGDARIGMKKSPLTLDLSKATGRFFSVTPMTNLKRLPKAESLIELGR